VKALVLAALLLSASPAFADDWELRLADRADVEVGVPATVSLTIAGLDGRVVSGDGPVRVSLSSSTLKTPRARYDRRHAADPAADTPRFDLRFTAPDAGDHTLAIDVRFWLCAKKTCRAIHATREVAVHATAPAAAP
jgi:hypothetical protein